MSRHPDIVLVHPPSIFDFRERTIFFGPISDVIPSTPLFEMYPIGFLTLAAYLRRQGYRVKIVNLALLMMRSRKFDPETFLRKLKPKLFGIDLHWLPHVHGSLALAELLKRIHPEIPIVFGGISSSYFHEELIREHSADFVLRGSVTEPCLAALLHELDGERQFERVPNLTWKRNGEVRINPLSFVPKSLDEFDFDLGMMIRDVVKHLDFWTTAPFETWWRHPITAVLTVRGCARACVTCGASHSAFKHFMQMHKPMLRSPEAIAKQVRDLAMMTRAPIFLVGDLTDGGKKYANDVIDALARTPVDNQIGFEFFAPPSREFLARIDKSIKRWGAELSPESHDESIRGRLGKARFTNDWMQEVIDDMLALHCEQLDLFFMVGLPGQTYRSVLDTVDTIERLFENHDRRLSAFITPMGPFIDPGSDGFESAKAHGYRMRAHTLAEHRALLANGSDWESFLNYETEWMTRAEIVAATYESAKRLNDLKERYGRITARRAGAVRKRIESEGIVNDKAELFEPATFLRNFRMGGILRLLFATSS
jgi:B12-binding domain/radical SAM domain protein